MTPLARFAALGIVGHGRRPPSLAPMAILLALTLVGWVILR